jgi:hypothetical protein
LCVVCTWTLPPPQASYNTRLVYRVPPKPRRTEWGTKSHMAHRSAAGQLAVARLVIAMLATAETSSIPRLLLFLVSPPILRQQPH